MSKLLESWLRFDKWWSSPEQEELRKSCATGWGFEIWKASRESLVVELPRPTCTYADHSYPAFSQKQVEKILVDCGIRIKGEGV